MSEFDVTFWRRSMMEVIGRGKGEGITDVIPSRGISRSLPQIARSLAEHIGTDKAGNETAKGWTSISFRCSFSLSFLHLQVGSLYHQTVVRSWTSWDVPCKLGFHGTQTAVVHTSCGISGLLLFYRGSEMGPQTPPNDPPVCQHCAIWEVLELYRWWATQESPAWIMARMEIYWPKANHLTVL